MKNRRTTKKPQGNTPDTRAKGAERIELVRQGLEEGKSNGQLARELGFDEGTIRRDIKKLELPEDSLDAVKNGESAEQHLRAARFAAAAQERETRLLEEKETGCHSNALAEHVLGFLMDKEFTSKHEEHILDKLDRQNWTSYDGAASARVDLPKTLLHCEHVVLRELQEVREQEQLAEPNRRWAEYVKERTKHRAQHKPCRTGEFAEDMPSRLELCFRALAAALPLIAPERSIRDCAIAKAVRAVQKPERRPRTAPPGYREYTVERRPY
jgi:hypothetical protein